MQYLGCFRWTQNDSLSTFFEYGDYNPRSLTVGWCSSTCLSKQYVFIGLTEGTRCFCGSVKETRYSEYGPSTDCDTPCVGNNSQTCGGDMAIEVYMSVKDRGKDHIIVGVMI